MSFIYFPQIRKTSNGEGGEGGIDAPVKSVNGKTGHVFLTFRDLNAVQNLQKSVGGIMVGKMNELPLTPEQNTLFISTDRVPNNIYLYNNNRWENLSGEDDLNAIAIKFNNSGINTSKDNVQDALADAFYQIDINKEDFELELENVEKEIYELQKTDGKVRLTQSGKLDFLENKLDRTIEVNGDILTVKGINGLFATIEELNQLKGIKKNVQQQIDRLSNIGSFVQTVPTHKDLISLENDDIEVNDMVIVLKDENFNDESTIYMLNKTRNWEYLGLFDIEVEIRDFNSNPIKLDSEVTNILNEKYIDESIARKSDLDKIKLNSTDDLPEGVFNKYFTDSRVNMAIVENRIVKDLVEKSHIHFNKDVIDELGETQDGFLTFRGMVVGTGEGGTGEGGSYTDGRVKISSNDVLGYLGTKIDNSTITTDGNKIYASSLKNMLATVDDINKLTGIKSNIQKQLDESNGLVKIDKYDKAGYLSMKIDPNSMGIKDGKVFARRLDGQEVNIAEINYLKGLKGNVQEQLDSLSKVGSFTAVVDKIEDLDSISNPLNGDLAMVTTDSNHEDMTTFYMYDKGKWIFAGSFHIKLRDFEQEPINLNREITGVLSEENIDPNIVRRYELDNLEGKIPTSTSELKEGDNLYFTQGRVSANNDVIKNKELRHNHDNRDIIDSLGKNLDGRLTFNGKEITSEGEIMWDEF